MTLRHRAARYGRVRAGPDGRSPSGEKWPGRGPHDDARTVRGVADISEDRMIAPATCSVGAERGDGGGHFERAAIGFTAIYAVLRFRISRWPRHMTVGAFAGYIANAPICTGLLVTGRLLAAFAVAGVTGRAVAIRWRCGRCAPTG